MPLLEMVCLNCVVGQEIDVYKRSDEEYDISYWEKETGMTR